MYGMATSTGDRDKYREQLLHELTTLRQEYDALMYGGEVATVVSVAAAWQHGQYAFLNVPASFVLSNQLLPLVHL